VTRFDLTPERLLKAYASGLFPMAEDRHDATLYWIDPEIRGVLPLDDFHVPRRLARTVRADLLEITTDRDFALVVEQCAAAGPGRRATWINDQIIDLYCELHRQGFAHSVECRLDGQLVGGLYGVSLNGAFFGESMFSLATDASKIALVHLVARLRVGGYALLDTQFVTKHLARFGVIARTRAAYHSELKQALAVTGDFYSLADGLSGREILQSITQTS
jgi:leucyl/phenylalanyl-tRNA--protein transferase